MAISLTPSAIERVKTYMLNQPDCIGLRLSVHKTGCSGWGYKLEMATHVDDGDSVIEEHGIKLVVDTDSLQYIDGTELDFIKEGLNERFQFNNPNVVDLCGCGESFTVDES